MSDPGVEDLLRTLAPQVLGALVRRYGNLDTAEDATQEALIAAAAQWPSRGLPADPRGWLITVASRRLTDLLRSEQARRRREDQAARWTLPEDRLAPAADRAAADRDDTLILLFMCCHPALSAASQIALALRAVAGLSTTEIARAFLVPEDTMTRRISRAKQAIRESGAPFALPAGVQRRERLLVVLHVLYLTFNEGYVSTSGPELQRADLAGEAIRLARMVHAALPDEADASGLLALMLLTDARRNARTGPAGDLIPMSDQDRSRWDATAIAEGTALVRAAMVKGPIGPYQLQAAIAAAHDEAPRAEATEWARILSLYELLLTVADTPVVALNHAVAVAMVHGPRVGLERLDRLEADGRTPGGHHLPAVRAHLLEMAGDSHAARQAYEDAADLAPNIRQQRYLRARADRLAEPGSPTTPP